MINTTQHRLNERRKDRLNYILVSILMLVSIVVIVDYRYRFLPRQAQERQALVTREGSIALAVLPKYETISPYSSWFGITNSSYLTSSTIITVPTVTNAVVVTNHRPLVYYVEE